MSRHTWIITDGKTGTEKQCLALAHILHLKPEVKKIRVKFPWTHLPPSLWFNSLNSIDPQGDKLEAPWPDIIIAAGRIAAAPAAAIKKLLGAKVKVIFIQNPTISPANFDFVIAPEHDQLSGKNVISITGAVTDLKTEEIEKEAKKWSRLLPQLPRPFIAVMLGGNSRHHTMTSEAMEDFGALLRRTALKRNMAFLVTASRRTPPEALTAFKISLGETPAYFWNGMGDNPYLGFLGVADFLLITSDSVSMISEALATEKPLYTLDLKSRSKRLTHFIEHLQNEGMIRTFDGVFDAFYYKRPDDREKILKILLPFLKNSVYPKITEQASEQKSRDL